MGYGSLKAIILIRTCIWPSLEMRTSGTGVFQRAVLPAGDDTVSVFFPASLTSHCTSESKGLLHRLLYFVFNIFRPVFQLFPLYDVPLLFQCDDLFSFCSVPIQNIFVWKINKMWNGQLLFHSNFIDNLDLLNLDLMNSESTELVCELWKFSFFLYIFRKLYHEGMKFLRKKSKKKFYSVWVPDYENANERVFLNPHSFSKNTIQDLN